MNNIKRDILSWKKVLTLQIKAKGNVISLSLKEVLVHPLLKKPLRDPITMNNFHLVSNLPFLRKVVEKEVAQQLQWILDEVDYPDPFQTGFRHGYRMETALVSLLDDLTCGQDRGCSSVLAILDFLVSFNIIDNGIILDWFRGLDTD